jgi:hypothetical protein
VLNLAALTSMPGVSDIMGTSVSLGREHVVSIMPLLKFDSKVLSLQVVTERNVMSHYQGRTYI